MFPLCIRGSPANPGFPHRRCILLLMFRRFALVPFVLALGLSPVPIGAQDSGASQDEPAATPAKSVQTTPKTGAARPAPPPTRTAASNFDPGQASEPATPPQIVVTSPPPQAPPWTWHDRVLWGSLIVLVILGYIAVLLSLKILKNIQRQTEFGVSAAQAALQCANAALESSQAIVDSGRPWIVVTVEPFLTVEHGFKVMATNRGRTPARIMAKADCVKIIQDETKLPATPDYESGKTATPFEPIILLPGESAGIRPFRRSDVRTHCSSDEQFRRIEKWEEKLFLYGRVVYRDLISPMDQPNHETDWCCWYVYSDKDALVIAGPPEYNKHN